MEDRRLLSFGLTTTSSTYTVDTGAQLTFTVARVPGSGSVGDLTSFNYSNTALEAPFSATSRYSHYESGLSSGATVTATVDPGNQWILITCNDTESGGVGVIVYYLARNGYNNIYMAFYSAGPSAPSPGEMRFIAYTNHAVLTNAPAPSDNTGNTGAIESSDVYGHADGTTSSKYYGEYRAIDTQTYGLTGGGFGVFMNIGNRETSSGGPFYKDIDYQTTSSSSTELYNYTFSGHSQTENFRPGLKGPFAMEFTTGATPAAPDYSFIDTLGIGSYITGYVGASGRGTLVGTASGVPSSLQETVGLSNAADQYWTLPNISNGAYAITGILPGTYTETIYQGELAVGTQTVTITAGQTTACNITDTLYTPSAANTIFTIGTWDGTPLGFLNSNLISDMHPTDVRMSPWAADSSGYTNFIVGTTPVSDWPMAEWHTQTTTAPYEDTQNRITFNLSSAQGSTLLTLRIGLTRLDSTRPNITVNSNWSSTVQAVATEPDSRGVTTGNWRGNNVTYLFNIPAGKLVTGTNTIDIYSVGGSTGTWYSCYQIYDAIDLVTTSSLTNAPVATTLSITPANQSVPVNSQQTYTATAYDQFGNPMPANFTWSTTLGTIDNTGAYTAPANGGNGTITVTSGTVAATTNISAVPINYPASAGDGFYLQLASDHLTEQIWVGPPGAVGPAFGAATYSIPLTSLPSLTFGPGSSTNGALTVDATNGSPIPGGGVSYDGGAGSDALNIIGGSGNDAVSVGSTTVMLGSASISYANVEAINVTLGGGTNSLTQTAQPGNAAALTLIDPAASDSLIVTGGTYTIAAPANGAGIRQLPLASLNVGSGAKVILANALSHADRYVLIAGALSLGGATSRLDLGDNDVDLQNGTALILATVQSLVTQGYSLGSWTGAGITSSSAGANTAHLTTLGVIENNQSGAALFTATNKFDGIIPGASDILLKYTYYGDTNLSGNVDSADYTRIDNGYIRKQSGWLNGDLNFDGVVNGSDYTLIDNAFNMQTASLATQIAPPAAVAANSFATTPIEPGTELNRTRKASTWDALVDWVLGACND